MAKKKAVKRKRPSAKRTKRKAKVISPAKVVKYKYRIYLTTPHGERIWVGNASTIGYERMDNGTIKYTGNGAYQRILNLVKALPSNWGALLIDRDVFSGEKKGEVYFRGRKPSEEYYTKETIIDLSAVRKAKRAKAKALRESYERPDADEDQGGDTKKYDTIRLS